MAVTLEVEGPLPQRRATIAFRVVLAIPHLLFGSVVASAALLVVIVAWFAALFTGRVPTGIAELLARILQYLARVYGYALMLLTDRYPPFDIGPVAHPVALRVDEPGTFNRAAVLFRAVLQLPALVVAQIAVAGVVALGVVTWLVMLVRGGMPPTIHVAHESVLRYQMRTYAFIGMLTSDYPRGLLRGDRGDLPRGAKNLVLLFLVLGLGVQAVNVAAIGGDLGNLSTASELLELQDALDDELGAFADGVDACGRQPTRACVGGPYRRLRTALEDYRHGIAAMDLPASAGDERAAVIADVELMLGYLGDLQSAESEQAAQRAAFQLEDAAFALDRDVDELYDAVLFS